MMKEALKQVSGLVERFERNMEAYRNPAYHETQLRREFVGPFSEALGWGVVKKAGYAEQYKDVVLDGTSSDGQGYRSRLDGFTYLSSMEG